MKFVFKVTEVNREILAKYPYAALDGDLTIIIKDTVFFDDGVGLLEFALCINSWLINVKKGAYLILIIHRMNTQKTRFCTYQKLTLTIIK